MPAAAIDPTLHSTGPRAGAGNPGACRVRDASVPIADRNYAMAVHLSTFAATVFLPLGLAPLVLWLIRKDKSSFIDDHGREVVNFGLSMLLFTVVLCWTIVVPIALFIVAVVNLIRGAIAASNGEYFRYPMTIRFLK
ncbi:MAG: DUF4870 domain-containing protein [Planctomycetota bacterium]